MIFDIHSHILPSVDDGASNEKATERMLRLAAQEGIGAIVATPHFVCGSRHNRTEEIRQKHLLVREMWKKQGEKKELFLGNELYYSEGIIEALESGEALTMNGTRYILVEFPTYAEFIYLKKAIQRLIYAGYIPIIAHVERYEHLNKVQKIEELVEMGAYIQVNVSTILGRHGILKKKYIMTLIRSGLVHFLGTDAHDSHDRKPEMKQCILYLEKKLGREMTRQLIAHNPKKMLRGEELYG